MPELVKVPHPDEENTEPRRIDEKPSKRERAVGFFREYPIAKWIVAALALVILAGGFFVWRYYSVRQSTDDAQIDGHISPISSRVSGTVLRVLHDENETVKAGDLLIELDPQGLPGCSRPCPCRLSQRRGQRNRGPCRRSPDHHDQLRPACCSGCCREGRRP